MPIKERLLQSEPHRQRQLNNIVKLLSTWFSSHMTNHLCHRRVGVLYFYLYFRIPVLKNPEHFVAEALTGCRNSGEVQHDLLELVHARR